MRQISKRQKYKIQIKKIKKRYERKKKDIKDKYQK